MKQESTSDEIEEDVAVEDQYDGLSDGMEVTCGGIITELKKLYSKKDGSELAIVKVEDLYGSFVCMLFGRNYANFKELLLVDNIVHIHGKLSINDKGVCVIVDKMSKIEEKKTLGEAEVKEEKTINIPKLYLMYDLTDEKLSAEIFSLLKMYPGDSPVIVKCSKQKKPFMLSVKVNPKGFLINELHAYIEDEYINNQGISERNHKEYTQKSAQKCNNRNFDNTGFIHNAFSRPQKQSRKCENRTCRNRFTG